MKQKFIDRENELEVLNRFFKEDSPQLIVVYGKRRIGKTELIKQFMKGKEAIYFLSRRLPDSENLKSLSRVVGKAFSDDFVVKRGFSEWDDLFEFLKKHVKKPTLFIIDEFPYLAEANKGISSVFQKGWDEYLKETPLFLILCGSSISMMISETLAYKAPLYGRRTGQIFLKPLPFCEARKFFPGANFNQALRLYSVGGGNPAYLLKLSASVAFEELVKQEIFVPEKFLYEEVDFILKEELREPRNYMSILKAIASGCSKFGEIINESGFEKSALHSYIFALQDLHMVGKEVPVTEKNPQKSRKGLYKIQDQFFRFWFSYVFPFKGELEIGNTLPSLSRMRKSFPMLIAQNYEQVARQTLRTHKKRPFPFMRLGRWWDKEEEIDIVGVNEETNQILFGEVKWSNQAIGTNIYRDLKRKAQMVLWGKQGRKEYFALFSKSGFTKEMKKIANEEKVLLFKEDQCL